MSPEKISLIIFLLSFLGLAVFILKKIPVLSSISADSSAVSVGDLFSSAKNKIYNSLGLKNFSLEIILHKIISEIRIFSLKTDRKTFSWLQKLREKNQKKRLENESYWDEIENSTQNPKK